jgi:hypothetical protein
MWLHIIRDMQEDRGSIEGKETAVKKVMKLLEEEGVDTTSFEGQCVSPLIQTLSVFRAVVVRNRSSAER